LANVQVEIFGLK